MAYKGNNTVHISPFSELGIKSQQIYTEWLITKITYSSSLSSISSIATEENQSFRIWQNIHKVIFKWINIFRGKFEEQYCIETWNVRSMNQGKLEVVKQEMARVNIDILGISELRWTGMVEFNSDDHYIYYVGGNPLEEME